MKICGDDTGWVDQILDLCVQRYVDDRGLLVTALNADGSILDATPLVADFGDVLPFLAHLGRRGFVDRQIELARPHLSGALFTQSGRTRLFDNHDWLLGLLELHQMTGEPGLLTLAQTGASTIIDRFFVDDLLVDSTLVLKDPRTWFRPASPFNGGFIELWLELYELTGEARFLKASTRLADRWAKTEGFRESGVFHRILCSYSATLSGLARQRVNLSARLFKDNTNFVWGLLALLAATGDPRWNELIAQWMSGFRRHFLNGGDVWLWLDQRGEGRDVSLKAAFSSIDLLCDLHAAGLGGYALDAAEIIARRWYGHQWANGLFPESPDGARDHLDANVDMAVALSKLAGWTGRAEHRDRAQAAAKAVVDLHRSPLGLVQAVDRSGAVCDGRIIVKYQSLALKLAIMPENPNDLVADPALLKLLRDR